MEKYMRIFSVERMSKVLGLSRGGCYKFLNRPVSKRQQENSRFACMLKEVHRDNHSSYGYRRLKDALKDRGKILGKNRIIRLMKENHIVAKYKKLFA